MAEQPFKASPPMKSTNGVEKRELDAQPKVAVDGVFVANTTFTCDLDGVAIVVHQGRDRVRAGHPLYTSNPQYFDPAEVGIAYDVEQADAVPGEARAHAGSVTKDDLLERARALHIEGRASMDKDQLAAAVAKADKAAK